MFTANAIRNICLLGHSGSGKSALAESLLYMTGAIDRIGRNADGNTVCDYDPEEIRRIFLFPHPWFPWSTTTPRSMCWTPPAPSTSPVL